MNQKFITQLNWTQGKSMKINLLLLSSILLFFNSEALALQIRSTPTTVQIKSTSTDSMVPLSFDDSVFKNVKESGPIQLFKGQIVSNLSIIDNSGDASVLFNGDGTINFIRMQTREGPRCTFGNMNLNWVWIYVYPEAGDHADGLQCYSPGSTGVVTIKNTTFYVAKG